MNYLEATDLIRLNAELEHDLTLDGDLVPLPGRDPLLLLANRHRDGYVFFYRQTMPPVLRQQIDSLGPQRAFEDGTAVQAILADYSPYIRLVEGVAGYFAETPAAGEFAGVIQAGDSYQIEIDGQAVSRAWTWFESDEAAELVVEALPDFRRHGYARQVAAAWAAGVMQAGRVALYSYLADNDASAALARSLGVVEYATWVAYMRCRSPQMSRSRVAAGGITADG
jgi:hypothetical protein